MEENKKRIIDWRDSKNKSSPKPSPWGGSTGRSISIDDYLKSRRDRRTYESSLNSHWGSSSSYFRSGGYYGGSSYHTSRSISSSIYGDYYEYKTKTLSDDETSKFETVLKKAIKLTKEFISILDLPFRVTLHFDNGSEEFCPHENTRQLFIPTSIFDDAKDRSDEELINTTVGLGIHEASHMLYTELSVYEEVYTRFWGSDASKNNKEKAIQALKILLFNLIEDERVDECLLSSRPGYREFVDAAKNYKLESAKKCQTIDHTIRIIFGSGEISDEHKEVFRLLVQLIYLTRYPSLLDDNYVKEHEEFFLDIQDDIDNSPKRTLDSVILSEKLVKKFISYIERKDSVFKIKGIESWIAGLNKNSNFFNLFTSEVLYGKDKVIEDNLGDSLQHAIYSIRNSHKSKKLASDDFKVNLLQLLGSIEKGSEDRILFWKNCKGNKAEYIKIANNVSKYCPQIRNKIKQVEKNEPIRYFGCRQGTLDTTKLVEAVQGVPQVYFRTGEVKTNHVSVAILVDESGSMGWSGRGSDRSRISISKDATILLNEALGSIPGIDLYIYGHSADEGTISKEVDIRIYREPGFPFNYSLTDLKGRYENRDGDAILNVAKRIRKFTEDPILFFVLSDGDPLAKSYHGMEAVYDTAKKVKQAEKLGFEIIQVQIGDGCLTNIRTMFSKYIILKNDLAQLPEKLGSILKKSILEKKKTTINF